MEKKHSIWLLIGCIAPLLLIFLAPMLGLSRPMSLFIFIALMFACHLLMPHGHGKDENGHQSDSSDPKEETYEQHSH